MKIINTFCGVADNQHTNKNMEVIIKRLLVIMLLLTAIGIASAGTIKIITDMKYFPEDVTLYKKNLDLGPHEPYRPLLDSEYNYNHDTRVISQLVEGNNLYWVVIVGDPILNFSPCEISEAGIDFRPWNYVIIEKWFFRFPVDPGTPITQ